jgi:hypothetical protein
MDTVRSHSLSSPEAEDSPVTPDSPVSAERLVRYVAPSAASASDMNGHSVSVSRSEDDIATRFQALYGIKDPSKAKLFAVEKLEKRRFANEAKLNYVDRLREEVENPALVFSGPLGDRFKIAGAKAGRLIRGLGVAVKNAYFEGTELKDLADSTQREHGRIRGQNLRGHADKFAAASIPTAVLKGIGTKVSQVFLRGVVFTGAALAFPALMLGFAIMDAAPFIFTTGVRLHFTDRQIKLLENSFVDEKTSLENLDEQVRAYNRSNPSPEGKKQLLNSVDRFTVFSTSEKKRLKKFIKRLARNNIVLQDDIIQQALGGKATMQKMKERLDLSNQLMDNYYSKQSAKITGIQQEYTVDFVARSLTKKDGKDLRLAGFSYNEIKEFSVAAKNGNTAELTPIIVKVQERNKQYKASMNTSLAELEITREQKAFQSINTLLAQEEFTVADYASGKAALTQLFFLADKKQKTQLLAAMKIKRDLHKGNLSQKDKLKLKSFAKVFADDAFKASVISSIDNGAKQIETGNLDKIVEEGFVATVESKNRVTEDIEKVEQIREGRAKVTKKKKILYATRMAALVIFGVLNVAAVGASFVVTAGVLPTALGIASMVVYLGSGFIGETIQNHFINKSTQRLRALVDGADEKLVVVPDSPISPDEKS